MLGRISSALVEFRFAPPLAPEKVRRGAEVVVERKQRGGGHHCRQGPGRPIDECITIAKARGSNAILDEDFAKDLEEVIACPLTLRYGTGPSAVIAGERKRQRLNFWLI